jgi:serine protease inhibitor
LAAVIVLVFAQNASSVESSIIDVNAVAKGNNEFATDLYARLNSDKSTNLFFSPYSISTALAMTFAGAEGPTGAEMVPSIWPVK